MAAAWAGNCSDYNLRGAKLIKTRRWVLNDLHSRIFDRQREKFDFTRSRTDSFAGKESGPQWVRKVPVLRQKSESKSCRRKFCLVDPLLWHLRHRRFQWPYLQPGRWCSKTIITSIECCSSPTQWLTWGRNTVPQRGEHIQWNSSTLSLHWLQVLWLEKEKF